jgi:ferredoxin
MAYVVVDECRDCKYTDCVAVCPVECFHEGPDMLYINPEVCIDCNCCVSECPVSAIYADVDLPEEKLEFAEKNWSASQLFPLITKPKEALHTAPPRQGKFVKLKV